MFKLVLTGDAGVGKSQLLSRFTRNEFALGSASTIGVEFSTKEVQINRNIVRCQIWDTAGQERFIAITKPFYRNALGALLIFDIQRLETFNNLDRWFQEIRANVGPNPCTIMLIGNKIDQRHIRAVTTDAAKRYAEEKNIKYMETSALDATNVEQAFQQLIQDVHEEYTKKLRRDSFTKIILPDGFPLQPHENSTKPEASSCCF
ncbi:unnamed protein product [Didymodactylos carnosus]|uniref:Uncharacterized protein n=1 Tax=Didymodactylos carnosus TaxID=1234261 RepID=A0A814ELN8_9BILA|nr:unnamed protein product [Didymodactylos carnosus]CAF0967928.1 unnamed protein product [Didymodactylos carnosus]CAF0967989.1 unnamed protein product [Didymodactylos carnosus]CAF3594568.1 unnamed protein product [Didymodactylos carnosus]CAF3741256.1 unnamed protein product [Didymodactylos carnosus]